MDGSYAAYVSKLLGMSLVLLVLQRRLVCMFPPPPHHYDSPLSSGGDVSPPARRTAPAHPVQTRLITNNRSPKAETQTQLEFAGLVNNFLQYIVWRRSRTVHYRTIFCFLTEMLPFCKKMTLYGLMVPHKISTYIRFICKNHASCGK